MFKYSIDLRIFIWVGAFIILSIWIFWEFIDWFWIDDVIKTTSPIIPEIELVIKDNSIDTVYIYRKP